MAYNKTVWENSPSTRTPINKDNLNKMEEGIYNAIEKYSPVDSEPSVEKVDSLRSRNKSLEFKSGDRWYTVTTKGEDGATFTPVMGADGTLSWTNNGGLKNPNSINLVGPKGTSFRYRGDYISNATYECNTNFVDLVTYRNSLWIKTNATQAEPGTTNDWNLAAKQGDRGEKGDTGPRGATGLQGERGFQGLPGVKGDKGDKGDTGPIGKPFVYEDFTAEQLKGLTGPKGDKGDTGPQGIQGIQGVKGEVGPIGPEGPQGPKGDKGDKGDTGAQGPQGPKGDRGESGASHTYTLKKEGSTISLVGSGGDTTSVTDANTTYTAGSMLKLTGSQFSVIDTCQTITDWNAATTTGWYMASGATNSPVAGEWFFGKVIAHNTNYVIQEVYNFTKSTDATQCPKYLRAKMNGTWGNWTEVTVQKKVPSDAKFTDTVYTHPANHPATMITTDATHRFATDAEKVIWNGVKSTMKTITIPASGWADGIYTLNDSLITATSNQEILPPVATSANKDMLKVIQKANLFDYGQAAGWLKLSCQGTIPTTEIQLRVIFRGEK